MRTIEVPAGVLPIFSAGGSDYLSAHGSGTLSGGSVCRNRVVYSVALTAKGRRKVPELIKAPTRGPYRQQKGPSRLLSTQGRRNADGRRPSFGPSAAGDRSVEKRRIWITFGGGAGPGGRGGSCGRG